MSPALASSFFTTSATLFGLIIINVVYYRFPDLPYVLQLFKSALLVLVLNT